MSDWQFRVDFADVWHQDHPAWYIAEVIVGRLEELEPKIRQRGGSFYRRMAFELQSEIIPLFEEIVDEQGENFEEFNYALDQLYDWADTSLDGVFGGKKMCWVATFK